MRGILVVCAMTVGTACGAAAAEQGLASFYGDPQAPELTAAHRTLPFGSQVKVVNLDNGHSVVVRIVDRGPFIDGRIIDVSPAAAASLGFRSLGLAHVEIDPLSAEMAQAGFRPRAHAATSPKDICRYGADRLGSLRGASRAAARRALGCEDLPSRLFAFAESSEDLTPLVARAAYLTEMEAAASIPTSAIAKVQQEAEPNARPRAELAARADATALDAAARISVSALLSGPAPVRPPSDARPATGCAAGQPCDRRGDQPAAGPVSLFFAQFAKIFD